MEKLESIMLKYFLKIGIEKEVFLPKKPLLRAFLETEKNGESRIVLSITGTVSEEYKKYTIMALDNEALSKYNSKTKKSKGVDFMKWFLLLSSRHIVNCTKFKKNIVIICNMEYDVEDICFLES